MPRRPMNSESRLGRAIEGALQYCFGPWPIRPGLIAVSLAFVNQYSIVRVAEATGESVTQAWTERFPQTIGQSVLIFVIASLVRVAQRRIGERAQGRAGYLISVIGISLVYSAIIALVINRTGGIGGLFAVRNVIAIMIVSAVFGIASYRVAQEGQRAAEALDVVREQREQLLVADEFARQEVADYLHDQVQGDLVVLSLQLGSLSKELPPEFGTRLNSILEELESLRMLDIRTASRRLSPDIATVGLASALRSMATGYSSTLLIEVECPRALNRRDEQAQLAVYRIVEQALLNAALHGKATHAGIQVTESHHDSIEITVTNDGRPLPLSPEPGAGTAIIEAWVSRYDGSWTLASESGATVLRARLHSGSPKH